MTHDSSNPTVRSPDLDQIVALVSPVTAALASEGHKLYLVGGVVRDLLLGATQESFSDIDLTTAARPEVVKSALVGLTEALWTQGERFGTIGATVSGRALEITTHRAEKYDKESRKPIVTFGDDLRTDLSRRDFTINAMAIDVTDGMLHDPFGGREDLAGLRLGTPLDPEISFADDPLRMLRAARFVARFGLAADEGLVQAANAMADRLAIVSRERIHDELERILGLPDPKPGLRFLEATGLITELMGHNPAPVPEPLPGGVSDGVGLACSGTDPLLRRCGLIWPLGLDGARAWLAALRYPTADRRQTLRLMEGASDLLTLVGRAERPAETVLRTKLRGAAKYVGHNHLEQMVQLASLVDAASSGASAAALGQVRRQMAELEKNEDLAQLRSPLNGGAIMKLLGVAPGPAIGAAVGYLDEKRLELGPLSQAEAESLILQWWQQQPEPTRHSD